MKFTLKQSRLGLRNSTTRLPFRYGNTCLTRCPQAVLEATVECDGAIVRGYSGDCLPPGWFDKSPEKSYGRQIEEMLLAVERAERAFAEAAARPITLFDAWWDAYHAVHEETKAAGLHPLVASFGVSFLERAIMDALARHAGVSFAAAVRANLFAIDAGRVHPSLAGLAPRDWLPHQPRREVFVRQTIGLADPLSTAEIPHAERLNDGFPQSIEEYLQQTGMRYFKLKLANHPERDRQRLLALAELLKRYRGEDYRLTLDGNEQYKRADDFQALVELLRGTPQLETLLHNTIAIEQPLERSIALEPQAAASLRALGKLKPVIIDESDAELMSYAQALELGYRGTSSKNCKGPIKSLLNAGLTWLANDRGRRGDYLMTGEDLCSVGVIPTQADLCLCATLGFEHVERNGHHYHPGLSYLPEPERDAALAAHGDFYVLHHGIIAPHVERGKFQIGSLQCVGFGFAVLPDMDSMQSPDAWQYKSLGLED
jgi:L-alanine-DL-glutamate epimerase-like enolase superfamily enzyme